jgi:hypothetical protein
MAELLEDFVLPEQDLPDTADFELPEETVDVDITGATDDERVRAGDWNFQLDRVYAGQDKIQPPDPQATLSAQRELIKTMTEPGAGDPATYFRLFRVLAKEIPEVGDHFKVLKDHPDMLEDLKARAAEDFYNFQKAAGTLDLDGVFEVEPGQFVSVKSAKDTLRSAYMLRSILRSAPITGPARDLVGAATIRTLAREAEARILEQVDKTLPQEAIVANSDQLARLHEIRAQPDRVLASMLDDGMDRTARSPIMKLLAGLGSFQGSPTGRVPATDKLYTALGADWDQKATVAFQNATERYYLSRLGLTQKNGLLAPGLPTDGVGVEEVVPNGAFLALGHAKVLQALARQTTKDTQAAGAGTITFGPGGTQITTEAGDRFTEPPPDTILSRAMGEFDKLTAQHGRTVARKIFSEQTPIAIAKMMAGAARGFTPEPEQTLTPIERAKAPIVSEAVAQGLQEGLGLFFTVPVDFVNRVSRTLAEKFSSIRELSQQNTYLATGDIALAEASRHPLEALGLTMRAWVDRGLWASNTDTPQAIRNIEQFDGATPAERRAVLQASTGFIIHDARNGILNYEKEEERQIRIGETLKGQRPVKLLPLVGDVLLSSGFQTLNSFLDAGYLVFEDPATALGASIGGYAFAKGPVAVMAEAKTSFSKMLGTFRLKETHAQLFSHNPEMAKGLRVRAQEAMELAKGDAAKVAQLTDLTVHADMVLDKLKRQQSVPLPLSRKLSGAAMAVNDPQILNLSESVLNQISTTGLADTLRLAGQRLTGQLVRPTKFMRLLLDDTGFAEAGKVLKDVLGGGEMSDEIVHGAKQFQEKNGRAPTDAELLDYAPESVRSVAGMITTAERLGPTYRTVYDRLFGRAASALVGRGREAIGQLLTQAKFSVANLKAWSEVRRRNTLAMELVERKAKIRISNNQYALVAAGENLMAPDPQMVRAWPIGMTRWAAEIQADEMLVRRIGEARNFMLKHDPNQPWRLPDYTRIMDQVTDQDLRFLVENYPESFLGTSADTFRIETRPTVSGRRQRVAAELQGLEDQITKLSDSVEAGIQHRRARDLAQQDLKEMERLTKMPEKAFAGLRQPFSEKNWEGFFGHLPKTTRDLYTRVLGQLPEPLKRGRMVDALNNVHSALDYVVDGHLDEVMAPHEAVLHRLRVELRDSAGSLSGHRQLVTRLLTEGPDNALVRGGLERARAAASALGEKTNFNPARELGRLENLRARHRQARSEYTRLARQVDPVRLVIPPAAKAALLRRFDHGGLGAVGRAARELVETKEQAFKAAGRSGQRGNPFLMEFAPSSWRTQEIRNMIKFNEYYEASVLTSQHSELAKRRLAGQDISGDVDRLLSDIRGLALDDGFLTKQYADLFDKREYDPRLLGALERARIIRDSSVRERMRTGSVTSSIRHLEALDGSELKFKREIGKYRAQVDEGENGVVDEYFQDEKSLRVWMADRYGPNTLGDQKFSGGIVEGKTPYGHRYIVAEPIDPQLLEDLDVVGAEFEPEKKMRRAEQLLKDTLLHRVYSAANSFTGWVMDPKDLERMASKGRYGSELRRQFILPDNDPEVYGPWAGRAVHKNLKREFEQASRSYGSLKAYMEGLQESYKGTGAALGRGITKAFDITNNLGRLSFILSNARVYGAGVLYNFYTHYVLTGRLPGVKDIVGLWDALKNRTIDEFDRSALEHGILDHGFFHGTKGPYKALLRKMYGLDAKDIDSLRALQDRRSAVYERVLQEEVGSPKYQALAAEAVAIEETVKRAEEGWAKKAGRGLGDTLQGKTDLFGEHTSFGGRLTHAYSMTDTPFRRLWNREFMKAGMSGEDAANLIKRHAQNYREMPAWLRNIPSPIASIASAFPYELARTMANNLNYRPMRALSFFALTGTWNLMNMARSGVDFDRLNAIYGTMRVDGMFEQTAKFLTAPMTFDPKSQEMTSMVDFTNIVPAFSVFGEVGPMVRAYDQLYPPEKRGMVGNTVGLGVRFANNFLFRSPAWNALGLLATGADPVSGRPIVGQRVPLATQLATSLQRMAAQFVHPWTPLIGYDWHQIQEALDSPLNDRGKIYHQRSASAHLIRTLTGLNVRGRPEEWVGTAVDGVVASLGLGKPGFARTGRTTINDDDIANDIVHSTLSSLDDNPVGPAIESIRTALIRDHLKSIDDSLDEPAREAARQKLLAAQNTPEMVRLSEDIQINVAPTGKQVQGLQAYLQRASLKELFARMPINAQVADLILMDRAGLSDRRMADFVSAMLYTENGRMQRETDATLVRRAVNQLEAYMQVSPSPRLAALAKDLRERVLPTAEVRERAEVRREELKRQYRGQGREARAREVEGSLR